MPSRPGSRDMLREASLSRPSTSHSTYSIGAATRGALSPIVSEGALSPDRVDVNDRGGVFKLTRPAARGLVLRGCCGCLCSPLAVGCGAER